MGSSSDMENVPRSMGSNPYKKSYGGETWRVESSSDAEYVEGQLGIK